MCLAKRPENFNFMNVFHYHLNILLLLQPPTFLLFQLKQFLIFTTIFPFCTVFILFLLPCFYFIKTTSIQFSKQQEACLLVCPPFAIKSVRWFTMHKRQQQRRITKIEEKCKFISLAITPIFLALQLKKNTKLVLGIHGKALHILAVYLNKLYLKYQLGLQLMHRSKLDVPIGRDHFLS